MRGRDVASTLKPHISRLGGILLINYYGGGHIIDAQVWCHSVHIACWPVVVVWCVHVGLRVMVCHCKSHVWHAQLQVEKEHIIPLKWANLISYNYL